MTLRWSIVWLLVLALLVLVLGLAPCAGASAGTATGSAMVIVEPRRHRHLQHVLDNFDANVPPHYDLYVFHGKSSGDFARAAAAGVVGRRRRRVVLVPLDTDNLSVDEYNALLKDPARFWSHIDAENVLLFQTDAIMCSKTEHKLADFEHLGYVGCAYSTRAGRGTHWGSRAYWGVGGLSFRKKSAALECLAKMPHQPADAEDVFYSECVEAGYGQRPRDGVQLSQFCSQAQMNHKSLGGHRVKDGMDPGARARFVDYCPEALPLLS